MTERYTLRWHPDRARLQLETPTGDGILDVPLDSGVDTLDGPDGGGAAITLADVRPVTDADLGDLVRLRFAVGPTDRWVAKEVTVDLLPAQIVYRVTVVGSGMVTDVNFVHDRGREPGHTQVRSLYAPRFDWHRAQVIVPPEHDESLGCQQWLSPPPLTYVLRRHVSGTAAAVWASVAPRRGAWNFVSFDWTGSRGASFRLTFEGHTSVETHWEAPALVLGIGPSDLNDAVAESVGWLRRARYLAPPLPRRIPPWWREPIFCGWGQMRYEYRADHDGNENGSFVNVSAYCTQLRYERFMAALDEQGLNPGTIIIDMGWAHRPALAEPHPGRWHDLRGFVDRQHARGRKVLLWYSPFVADGIPDEACLRLASQVVAPDPTSPVYLEILAEQLRLMLGSGPGCLDADGLKIDFTQCTPSENGRFVSRIPSFWGLINESDGRYLYPRLSEGRRELITVHEPVWGIELLHRAVAALHAGARATKPDAVLVAHTSNPYFEDVVDVLRLNDLDGDCEDVLGVMANRAALARICSPYWLLDTDDDLMIDKERWKAYAALQPQLGIPDTYYVTGIAASGETIGRQDAAAIAEVWASYRGTLST